MFHLMIHLLVLMNVFKGQVSNEAFVNKENAM